ncbi:MAG TPA: PRC-barrel domain-containing protein [Rubrobacteraceae bacterium]|nr:PRC-barrel domain-containing protein [Rubrobacteraceae bacterium]
MASDERLRELEEKYEGYKVYDNRGEKIGKVDDLFIDESDREEYIGVKMGLFGTKSTLIPMDIVRVNESDRTIEVSESKDRVKDAPNFSDDDDITPDYEDRIRSHFGLESLGDTSSRGSYGSYGAAGAASAGRGVTDRDRGDYDDRDDRDRDSRDISGSGERGYDERRDRDTGAASRVDTEYGERAGSSERGSEQDRGASSSRDDDSISSTTSGDREGHSEYRGSEDLRRESSEPRTFGSGGSSDEDRQSESGGSFGESETREMPMNRQTEETETFQEGGRTKVRRRIIREEIIEEDPDQR